MALLSELLELVLPVRCAGCGRAGAGSWCAACRRGIGLPRLVRAAIGVPPVVAVGRYTGPLRAALLAYKERGRRELADVLARQLAGAALHHPAMAGPTSTHQGAASVRTGAVRWWLVPAPSRASAARARGGDHMAALARRVAELIAGPLAADGGTVGVGAALRVARGVRDSVGLDPDARSANLVGRMRVVPSGLPPPGVRVLLVDDVVTTGATLRACASALISAGCVVPGSVVLCDATGTHRARTVTPTPER